MLETTNKKRILVSGVVMPLLASRLRRPTVTPRTESAPSPTLRASILAAIESPAGSTGRLSGCELSAVGARRHPTVVLTAVRYTLPLRLNTIRHQSGFNTRSVRIGLAVGVNVDQFGCNNLRGARLQKLWA